MRCFIGIPVEEWTGELSKLLEKIKRGTGEVKWVKVKNLHVTLKFLGEIEENMVEKVKNTLTESLHDVTSFFLTASDLGAFPSLSSPRVIWLGIGEGKEKIEKIFKEVEKGLIECGIPPEGRKYHPHITLGRIKRSVNRGWWKGVLNMKLPRFPRMVVREVVLYQSCLHSEGPEYKVLKRYNLGEL